MRKNISGFTIVELLIVIVVISILATMSVGAFQGIQNRAKATRYSSAVNQYTKLLELYRNTNGSYPSGVAAEYPSSGESCLGDATDYPADGAMPSGYCLYDTGSPSWRISSSATLAGQLKNHGSLPKPPLDVIPAFDTERWRGIRYRTGTQSGKQYVEMQRVVKGLDTQYCGDIGGGQAVAFQSYGIT